MGTHVFKQCRYPKVIGRIENSTRESQENRGDIYRNLDRRARNIDVKRVRFILLENTNVENQKEIEVYPEAEGPSTLPSLPAICELMIFSGKGMEAPKTSKQKNILPKQPLIQKPNEDLMTKQKRESQISVVKLPPATPAKCSTQELRIHSKCMMPEDYKDPSQSDTRKRILAWLDEAEKAKPTFRRRFNTFT